MSMDFQRSSEPVPHSGFAKQVQSFHLNPEKPPVKKPTSVHSGKTSSFGRSFFGRDDAPCILVSMSEARAKQAKAVCIRPNGVCPMPPPSQDCPYREWQKGR